jgi:hypothetical protein
MWGLSNWRAPVADEVPRGVAPCLRVRGETAHLIYPSEIDGAYRAALRRDAPVTLVMRTIVAGAISCWGQQAFAAPSPPDGSLPLAFQGMMGVSPCIGAAASAAFTNPTAAPEFALSVVRHPRGVKRCTWADAAGATPNTIKTATTTATVILRFTVSPFPRLAFPQYVATGSSVRPHPFPSCVGGVFRT